MTVSAISRYRGGAAEDVLPLSRALKDIYARHGVAYRLSQVEGGPDAGDWIVIVTYPDAAAQARLAAQFAADPALDAIFRRIAAFASRISRDIVNDIDL